MIAGLSGMPPRINNLYTQQQIVKNNNIQMFMPSGPSNQQEAVNSS